MITSPRIGVGLAIASAGAALAPVLVSGPLAAQEQQEGRTELSASFTQPAQTTVSFTDEFESLIEPVSGASPTQSITIPAHAVDLKTFEPPLQPRPPVPSVVRDLGTGVASYYGRRFHGRLTANGERFNMNAMTAAHKTLAFGTRVRVTNPRNGRSVVVRINDRGPFIKGRTIDLSRGAAQRIGMISSGHARVKLDIIK